VNNRCRQVLSLACVSGPGDPFTMSRFSETLMDHFQAPRNLKRMESPDAVGLAGVPGQGRYLVLYVRIVDGRIAKAQYECHGCGVTIACGSALTELLTGRSLGDSAKLSSNDLVEALDGVPPDRADCPAFVMHAWRHVLQQISANSETRHP
jgi:nitrogen fixation protein NifU and related proteins